MCALTLSRSESPSSWNAVFSWFSGGGSQLLHFSDVAARRSSSRTLRREPLEQRHLLSAASLLAGVSPTWFEYVGDSDTVGHANPPGLSAEMIRDSEETSTESGSVADAFDWIVRFDTKSLENAKVDSVGKTASLLAGEGMEFEVIRGLGLVGQVLVRSTGVTADMVESWLADNQHVASYELDSLHEVQTTPNDSYYSLLWGMQNGGQSGGTAGADIDAPQAWDISTGSSSIVVGVIDSGVDYTHPDLVSNIWTNPGEIAGNGVDDDGNGFIDDIHGYDFVNNDGDPMDDNNHGTHVSGTIAGAGNNGQGVTGVNWSSSIMGLKFLSGSGSGYTSDAIRAINYATMMRTTYGVNVRVTNNSWGGGGFSTAMEDAIQASGDAGILFVAAAGNDGTNNDVAPHYPSNYTLDNVLSVAATDHNDNLASFSNYGQSTVHLAAPGVSIASTIPGGGYAYFSGTSMATPHVAGVAALAWSVNPDATVAEIRSALLQGTEGLSSLSGKCTTGGRLNAFNTLELLSGDGPSAPVIASLGLSANYITAGESTTLTAYGVDDFDGTVSSVSFYRDANGDGLYDAGDTLLTTVSPVEGTQVSHTLATDGWASGSHVFFARALDNDGQWSGAASGTLVLVAPDDHGNDSAGASAVLVGNTIAGAIERDGDVDWFAFTATAGGVYRFETTLGSLADSYLYLYDQDGVAILNESDDILWPDNLGSRITWQAESAGTYYLAVEAESEGLWGDYTLQLTDMSGVADDHGNDSASATLISLGDTVGGALELAWDEDWFSFEATAGTTYLFDVELIDLGDSELYLYDSNGTSILEYNDDFDFAVDLRSRISWTAEVDGTFYLSVNSYCEAYSGDYTLTAAAVADDHGNSAATSTMITVGDTVAGNIEFGSDVDFFAVELETGGRYSFQTNLIGLSDSVLYLYGPGGWELLEIGDDVSWPDDPSSHIEWVAETSGTYYLAVEAYDYTEIGDYTLDVELLNFVPILEPLSDQLLEPGQDSVDVTLTASNADGDPLTYAVQVLGTDTYAALAYTLDQELGLYQHRIGYLDNLTGEGEKFIASDNGWHILLPNGEFYEWGGSVADSTLVATLSPRYYLDPTLLHEAIQPVSAEVAGLTLNGNVLTIDPADGYFESFFVRVEVTDGFDTSFDTFEVGWNMPDVVDLGTVGYAEVLADPTASGSQWFQLVTQHDGYLSIEALLGEAGSDVTLRLRDENYAELGVWNSSSAEERLDHLVSAGETFYVEIIGQVDLRLANLVQCEGDTVTVHGTEGDDHFAFTAGEQYRVVVKGVEYLFDSSLVSSITFDGHGGQDTSILTGSSSAETIQMRLNSTTLIGVGYRVEANNMVRIDAYGGGGSDRAYLYDSAGDDRFYGKSPVSWMVGDGFFNAAWGFERVDAYATYGGNDRSYLYDSAGDDRFYGKSPVSWMVGDGFFNAAWGFERVDAYATYGGNDRGYLYDSAGDDRFYGKLPVSWMVGDGFFNAAWGFERVDAYATYGGSDRGYFYDSAGDDRFYGKSPVSWMVGDGFFNAAWGFERVDAYATYGGNDRSYLYDSAGDDRFYGKSSVSWMVGDGFFNAAWGFERVDAYATYGGNDRGYLYDSVGDDRFYGKSPVSWMVGDAFFNAAWGFERVDAYATYGGNDRGYLYDSAGDDRFYGKSPVSWIVGDGFFNAAWGFERIDAYATYGGNDRGYLYDSAGNDRFYGKLPVSWMVGDGFFNAAWGFERIDAYATYGGNDRGYLYDSAGDDRFYGKLPVSWMVGDGFFNAAWGFGRIDAYAIYGGYDRAYLYDSALDDYLDVNDNRATLSYGPSVVSVTDFAWVQANSSLGGNDEKCIELIDFALELLGAWMDE